MPKSRNCLRATKIYNSRSFKTISTSKPVKKYRSNNSWSHQQYCNASVSSRTTQPYYMNRYSSRLSTHRPPTPVDQSYYYVSLHEGRVLCRIERMIRGTRYESFAHTWRIVFDITCAHGDMIRVMYHVYTITVIHAKERFCYCRSRLCSIVFVCTLSSCIRYCSPLYYIL